MVQSWSRKSLELRENETPVLKSVGGGIHNRKRKSRCRFFLYVFRDIPRIEERFKTKSRVRCGGPFFLRGGGRRQKLEVFTEKNPEKEHFFLRH